MKVTNTTKLPGLWLGVGLLSLAALPAQAQNPVTFQVDMTQQPTATDVFARGSFNGWGNPDPYVNALLALVRPDPAHNMADRLIALSLVEARSCERFLLLAEALEDTELKNLYAELARPEEGHARLFVQLAERYAADEAVAARLAEFRVAEATIVAKLPNQPRMHG